MIFKVTPRGLIDLQQLLDQARADMQKFIDDNPPRSSRSPGRILEMELMARERLSIEDRIGRYSTTLLHCVVVDRPTDTRVLQIGHIATIRRLTAKGEGTNEKYRIGGHLESDPKANPPLISYEAPLIASLIGSEVGTVEDVTIGGQAVAIELIAIDIPAADQPTLAAVAA